MVSVVVAVSEKGQRHSGPANHGVLLSCRPSQEAKHRFGSSIKSEPCSHLNGAAQGGKLSLYVCPG